MVSVDFRYLLLLVSDHTYGLVGSSSLHEKPVSRRIGSKYYHILTEAPEVYASTRPLYGTTSFAKELIEHFCLRQMRLFRLTIA